ncbi:MAG: cache domain-containing protein [Pseudomonadota bacterium]
MKKKLLALSLLFNSLAFTGSAWARERMTPEEAIDLAKKASAYIKKNGKDKAFLEFSKKEYTDYDLGVLDMEGKVLLYTENVKIVGKDVQDIRDADGKQFVKECLAILKIKPSCSVEYKWPDPFTQQMGRKFVYLERVGDLAIGSGAYK